MDTTLNAAELWRLIALLDVALLFGCAVYLHGGYGAALPGPLQRLGYAYGAVLVMVAVAIVANFLSTAEPTIGVKLFAITAAAAAAYVLAVTVQVARGHH